MAVVQTTRSDVPGDLPRRDIEARARLTEVGTAKAPLVLARDRVLTVPGPLGDALPRGVVQRGTVVTVAGPRGSGASSTGLGLLAAATTAGEWAAAVDLDGTLGGLAATDAGIDLARFAVVRSVPPDRWATVVAALLDGVTMVLAELPRSVRLGDARRLTARARERSAVLVTVSSELRMWPGEAALRIQTCGGPWTGLGDGDGMLEPRTPVTEVEGRGAHTGLDRGGLDQAGLDRALLAG